MRLPTLSTPRRSLGRRVAAALAAVLVLGGGPASAWQLPARHALKRAATALRPSAAVEAFEWSLTGRGRLGAGEDGTPLGVRWGFVRSSHRAGASLAWAGGKSLSWTRDRPPADSPDGLTLAERVVIPRLLADADPATLAQQIGLDMDRRHLALLGDEVAEVLGAAGPAERDVPQLWLRHADGLPLRVVFRTPEGAFTRIDLLSWSDGADDIPCPQRVIVHVGGRWVRTYEAGPARRSPPPGAPASTPPERSPR